MMKRIERMAKRRERKKTVTNHLIKNDMSGIASLVLSIDDLTYDLGT